MSNDSPIRKMEMLFEYYGREFGVPPAALDAFVGAMLRIVREYIESCNKIDVVDNDDPVFNLKLKEEGK